MWKIPIRDSSKKDSKSDEHNDLKSLPVNYMGEWGRLGLLVREPEKAADVLNANGYQVRNGDGELHAWVEIDHPEKLGDILSLLNGNGIEVESGDVIDEIYRG